jgi:hypothetical protein
VKKQFVLPLAAMFIATPIWARQHHGGGSSISVSATALSFNGSSGNVSSQPLTITSTGQQSVTIQKLSFSNGTFYGSSAPLPVTLSPGQRLIFTVVAKPEGTAQSGILTIDSTANDPTVSLTETATTPPSASHSASLTWKAPATSSDPVDSYQVDRAPSGSTAFASVGTTAAASTAFTDNSVAAGQTYVYEVRAVDQSGNMSTASNTVTLTIP